MRIGFRPLACVVGGASLVLGMACTPDVDEADLYGHYEEHHPNGVERLMLNADGTYTQQVVIEPSPDARVNHGTWTWDESTDRVTLRDCWVVVLGDIDRDLPLAGVCRYWVDRSWFGWGGEIRLAIGDHYLTKQD